MSARPQNADSGSPPPIALPIVQTSGGHAQIVLRPARRLLERRLDLIKKQHDAGVLGQTTDRLQISRPGLDAAGIVVDRLQDHHRRFPPVLGDGAGQGVHIVEGDGNDEIGEGRGNPRRLQIGMRPVFRAGRRWVPSDVDEFVIPVKMPFHADDLVPAGEGPARPDQMQRGLRAGGAKPDPLGARDAGAQLPRQLLVVFRLEGMRQAHLDGPVERPLDRRMGVPEQGRAMGAAHVNEFAALDAPDPGAAGARHVEGRPQGPVEPDGGVDAARQDLSRLVVLALERGHGRDDGVSRLLSNQLCASRRSGPRARAAG